MNFQPRIGFEAEFLMRRDGSPTISRQLEGLIDGLEREAHLTFYRDGRGDARAPYKDERTYTSWYLENDSSIKERNENGEWTHGDTSYGVEIISPVLSFDEFVSSSKKLLELSSSYHLETNETTGFHVGISFEGIDLFEKLDPLKMMLLLGEDHLMKTFQRSEENQRNNLASRVSSLREEIQQNKMDSKSSWYDGKLSFDNLSQSDNFNHAISTLREMIITQVNHHGHVSSWGPKGGRKSFTVAFFRLEERNYVEFRIPGDADYHKRHDDIVRAVKTFIAVMRLACTDELDRKYREKVARLLLSDKNFGNDSLAFALRDHPRMLRQLYTVENGSQWEWDDVASHQITEEEIYHSRNVAWRLLGFLDSYMEERESVLNMAVVRRHIRNIRIRHGITNTLILSLLEERQQNNDEWGDEMPSLNYLLPYLGINDDRLDRTFMDNLFEDDLLTDKPLTFSSKPHIF